MMKTPRRLRPVALRHGTGHSLGACCSYARPFWYFVSADKRTAPGGPAQTGCAQHTFLFGTDLSYAPTVSHSPCPIFIPAFLPENRPRWYPQARRPQSLSPKMAACSASVSRRVLPCSKWKSPVVLAAQAALHAPTVGQSQSPRRGLYDWNQRRHTPRKHIRRQRRHPLDLTYEG